MVVRISNKNLWFSCIIFATLWCCIIQSVFACRNCQTFNNHLDPKSLASARIEAVKQRILSKLRMDRAPVIIKAKRPVPKILLSEMHIGHQAMYGDDSAATYTNQEDYGLDEFYAKDGPVVIFAETGKTLTFSLCFC